MDTIFQQIKSYIKPARQPARAGQLAALNNAVLIVTDDGHNVVLTPALARDIAPMLMKVANVAEGVPHGTQSL